MNKKCLRRLILSVGLLLGFNVGDPSAKATCKCFLSGVYYYRGCSEKEEAGENSMDCSLLRNGNQRGCQVLITKKLYKYFWDNNPSTKNPCK